MTQGMPQAPGGHDMAPFASQLWARRGKYEILGQEAALSPTARHQHPEHDVHQQGSGVQGSPRNVLQ